MAQDLFGREQTDSMIGHQFTSRASLHQSNFAGEETAEDTSPYTDMPDK